MGDRENRTRIVRVRIRDHAYYLALGARARARSSLLMKLSSGHCVLQPTVGELISRNTCKRRERRQAEMQRPVCACIHERVPATRLKCIMAHRVPVCSGNRTIYSYTDTSTTGRGTRPDG